MSGIIILTLGILLLLVFGSTLLTKKTGQKTSPEKARIGVINGALLSVIGLLMILFGKPSHGEAVVEVLRTINNSDSAVHNYHTGSLADGVAVMVNGSAGYWVKDGQVYVVNEAASQLS